MTRCIANKAIMPLYRLLVFSDNRLIHAECVEAHDHVDAIKACSERHLLERVELWADEGRIAILGSASRHHTPR